jgi:L-serine/L-threonine ammonia-lyase
MKYELWMVFQEKDKGCTKFVGSSGGNAGLALAYTANKLNVPCQIFVPENVVPRMLSKIRAYGAEITVCTGKGLNCFKFLKF